MTIVVNTHEAKTHLSRLLAEVERGAEIIIARDGKPVARLVPAGRRPPEFDAGRGLVEFRPGWDAALTDEELDEWYGPIEPPDPQSA